jgi:hypothetical protein
MQSLESIYNSILLENQNPNNIDIELLKKCVYGIPGTYTINDDGSIDVEGNVILVDKKLTKIPFKFRHVSGGFYCCSNNHLTSLDGAPINVGGDFFYCSNNHLTSLDGAPNFVGGNFYCYHNPNLSYTELFKIIDNVKGNIYYSSKTIPEDKDKIRRGRDVKAVLKDDELGNLDI